jgi:hypothetical protein
MLLLSKPLAPQTAQALQNLQDAVNNKTTFVEAVHEAHYTIQLLNLNRDQLATARFQAARYFISRLQLYAHVKTATDFDALEAATDDFKPIDTTISFTDEQSNILKSIKADILHYPHPTVWAEMKRQRNSLIKTNELFLKVPEALDW